MVAQFDPPPSIDKFRSTLNRIYKSPSAVPPVEVFNIQEPLPPVPYTPDPPQPITLPKTATPPTPTAKTAPTTPLSIPQGATPPPTTTNPVPRVAPPSGSSGAAVVTLTGGGVISGAGLLTGGLSLLAGGLLVHDAHELYKLFKLSQPEVKAPQSNLVGGNKDTFYVINGVKVEVCSHYEDFRDSIEVTWFYEDAKLLHGPIALITKVGEIRDAGGEAARGPLYFRQGDGTIYGIATFTSSLGHAPVLPKWRKVKEISVRAKNVSEPESEPEPTPQQRRSPIKSGITPSPTPQSIFSPNPSGVQSPTSPPSPADNPLATNNRVPYVITTPGGNPITITTPGGNPITITPAGTPATIKVTRPSASPFLTPSPANTPRTTPTGDPVTTPTGVPIAVSSPGSAPTNLVMPGTNPITITYPGQAPIVIDPSTSKPPQGVQATPIPKPGAFITTPAAPTQTPTNPATTPTTPTKPGTPTTPTIPGVKDPDLEDIGLKLVALTALIQGVNKNTTPNAIANAVAPTIAPAVCSTTAPGGCSSNMTSNAVGKGVDDLKDFFKKNGLDAAAQLEQLRLLNQLDGKMGAQMPGGVAGAFGRLSSFLGVDRIFNLINFMANLHNAFMLSNSLKVTLLEMLSSVGNATGLLQTAEGENVDLNEVYNKGVRALINSVLGDEQAARLEIQFRRANRIYQAATNSLNAVSSMMSSLGNVVETGAEYGGKIGNALKAAGAVHEKAYQWMAEKFDAKVSPFMKYSQTVNGVNTALETINEIAESVVEGQQAATEFQKANAEFVKAVADVQKNPGIENKAIAAEVAKQKENATKDPTGEDETGLLSFLTDL